MRVDDIEELRVLLITNTLSISGGSESLVLNIFHALKTRPGIKVKLVTLKSENSPTGFEIPELEQALLKDPDFSDCDCNINFSVLKRDRVDVSKFTDIVTSFRPHVIHSHLFLSELVAHEIVFPGITYITHCHDNMSQLRRFSLRTFTRKNFFTNFYERRHLIKRYLRCNNNFIAVSEDTRQYFETVLPSRLKKNVRFLPNAIVTKRFYNNRSKNEKDLGVIRILNVGSFIPIKNQQLLVDITNILVQRGHRVKVTMLGSGPEFETVKAKVEAAKLEDVISMPGTKSNVADYYAGANIYVHTCTHEAFGLVFLEAMASGLPVVSLDAKGNRGLIKEGETGYMIQDQNPEYFADAIEKVLKDKDTYHSLSVNAGAFAKNYDIVDYTTRLISIYKTAPKSAPVIALSPGNGEKEMALSPGVYNKQGGNVARQELRVLLITNSMTISGGAEALVLNIYKTLKTRPGVKVKLVTLKKAARKTGYEIPGIEGPLSTDPDFFDCNASVGLSVLKPNKIDVQDFTGLVESFKPHVIHSHLFLSELVAHEIIFPGIKYFSHCHDNMSQLQTFSIKTLFKKILFTNFFEKRHLVKRYLKCNNKFISISADTKNYFESVLPSALRKNIISLDNAIVVKNFPGYRTGRDLKTIRIINVGRFTTTKNQQFLVDITRVLVQRGHQVKVVMLGKGEEYDHVKTKIDENNLQSIISLPGTKANMADYYAAANVYVHVCRHEPFGLVLLEAMASGLPVVSLDGRGNRGLIQQGENGFMLTNENADDFAGSIEKVLKDREIYSAMSARAFAFAQKYDIEEYINRLIEIYLFG